MKATGNGFTIVAATRGVELPDPNRRLRIPDPRRPAALPAAPAESAATSAGADVPCEVCGLLVTAAYLARTGRAMHGSCQPADPPAEPTGSPA